MRFGVSCGVGPSHHALITRAVLRHMRGRNRDAQDGTSVPTTGLGSSGTGSGFEMFGLAESGTFSTDSQDSGKLPSMRIMLVGTIVTVLLVSITVYFTLMMPEDKAVPTPAIPKRPEVVNDTDAGTAVIEESKDAGTADASDADLDVKTKPGVIITKVSEPTTTTTTTTVTKAPTEPVTNIPKIPEISGDAGTKDAITKIKEAVKEFKVQQVIQPPPSGAVAGIVSSVHAVDAMSINGEEIRLAGVSRPEEGEEENNPDSNQAREALLRLCPPGSLGIYEKIGLTTDGIPVANVWCHGYPPIIPTVTVNEVLHETAYANIGYDCHAPHMEGVRRIGCSY